MGQEKSTYENIKLTIVIVSVLIERKRMPIFAASFNLVPQKRRIPINRLKEVVLNKDKNGFFSKKVYKNLK